MIFKVYRQETRRPREFVDEFTSYEAALNWIIEAMMNNLYPRSLYTIDSQYPDPDVQVKIKFLPDGDKPVFVAWDDKHRTGAGSTITAALESYVGHTDLPIR